MYSKKTKKINITVNPYFLDDQSEPEDQHFVWAYQVTIDNQSSEKVQLKNRYWIRARSKRRGCGRRTANSKSW